MIGTHVPTPPRHVSSGPPDDEINEAIGTAIHTMTTAVIRERGKRTRNTANAAAHLITGEIICHLCPSREWTTANFKVNESPALTAQQISCRPHRTLSCHRNVSGPINSIPHRDLPPYYAAPRISSTRGFAPHKPLAGDRQPGRIIRIMYTLHIHRQTPSFAPPDGQLLQISIRKSTYRKPQMRDRVSHFARGTWGADRGLILEIFYGDSGRDKIFVVSRGEERHRSFLQLAEILGTSMEPPCPP